MRGSDSRVSLASSRILVVQDCTCLSSVAGERQDDRSTECDVDIRAPEAAGTIAGLATDCSESAWHTDILMKKESALRQRPGQAVRPSSEWQRRSRTLRRPPH